MNTSVRRRLDAAVRLRNMSRGHPFTDPQHAEVTALFERRVTEAEALLVEERTGRATARGATNAAQATRRALITRLRIIARTAALASAEAPALPKALGVPAHSVGNRVLISAARSMVTTATGHHELLTRYGLSGSLLAEVTETVDRFQGEAGRAVDALHSKNEARGRLKAVMSELSGLTRLLDAINQVRFAGDAGLLTAWNRARNVVGAPAPAQKSGQGGTPGGEVAA